RGRLGRPPEPFDPDLPPSRTQRSRIQPPPAPRAPMSDAEELSRPRAFPELDEPVPPPSRVDRDPRRARGRGRPSRPINEPDLPFEVDPLPAAEEGAAAEPTFGDRLEPPRRRGGRAAIRSRGGEREP